jgi:excisionase family DNA binding protein
MQKTQEIGADDILLSSEVMAIAKISRRTLERWVADGTLPATKVGGRGARRYRRTDVEALLRGEAVATPDLPAADVRTGTGG